MRREAAGREGMEEGDASCNFTYTWKSWVFEANWHTNMAVVIEFVCAWVRCQCVCLYMWVDVCLCADTYKQTLERRSHVWRWLWRPLPGPTASFPYDNNFTRPAAVYPVYPVYPDHQLQAVATLRYRVLTPRLTSGRTENEARVNGNNCRLLQPLAAFNVQSRQSVLTNTQELCS